MKNFTQKFIGLFALVLTMCFTANAQQIGGIYEGGYIFQINEDGTGLVADLQDDPYGGMNWDDAMGAAASATSQGYDDWYLPSIEELQLMYSTIGQGGGNIGGFQDDYYWSSSETFTYDGYFFYNAWNVYFNDGNSNHYSKNSSNRVRVIRSVILGPNFGCTDSEAFNYNDEATEDDGSCLAIVNGCIDSTMSNYNSEANTEDGSCVSWEGLANDLQGQLDNIVPEDGVSQADVDAAYAGGVASVEVPECEEVATQNIPLDLPQGWSMFGYTCLESLDVVEAFSDISDNIEIVKDEWGLAYLPAWGFSAFDNLEFGEGYQIKMIEEVTDFQFCTTIAGGASQEELDAAYDEGAASITPEDGIGQDDVDAAYAEGAASVTPEDGVSQSDLDALAESFEGYTAPLDLQIGDIHAGGIVFQINENGSGLVAAMEDIGPYNWSEALSEASNYSSEGYTGWHLPSSETLELMYNTIGQGSDNSGNFEYDWYWSSSEGAPDTTEAWYIDFWNGYEGYISKNSQFRVRLIRAF